MNKETTPRVHKVFKNYFAQNPFPLFSFEKFKHEKLNSKYTKKTPKYNWKITECIFLILDYSKNTSLNIYY